MGDWGWMKTRIGKFLLLHRREIQKKKKKSSENIEPKKANT
jgi:hypothetical protein